MLSERIKKIREDVFKGSQDDFADALKWPKSRVKDLERGKVKELKGSEAEQLEEKFLRDGWWVLTGKGNMLAIEGEHLPVAVQAHPEDDENTVALNYYPDIVAAAGYGGINEYEFRKQTMKFDRRFLEQFLNVRRFDCLDIITVFGNSMEPFISNGETVIVERIDDARNGETVIANINGDIYIKRIKKDPLNRWVKFLSNNNEYDEIELKGKDLEHVTIIGIVRAKIRPF